jgi:hypothetical protein
VHTLTTTYSFEDRSDAEGFVAATRGRHGVLLVVLDEPAPGVFDVTVTRRAPDGAA